MYILSLPTKSSTVLRWHTCRGLENVALDNKFALSPLLLKMTIFGGGSPVSFRAEGRTHTC